MEQILQILAIPKKRTETRLVKHLSIDEMQAILDAPDPATRDGIRDRAMLHVAYGAGLRVSELVGLRVEDVTLGSVVSIRIRGKGRKERALPLWKETASAVRAWLAIRDDAKAPELFLNAKGEAMITTKPSSLPSRSVLHPAISHQPSASLNTMPTETRRRRQPHLLASTFLCSFVALMADG